VFRERENLYKLELNLRSLGDGVQVKELALCCIFDEFFKA